MFQLYTQTFGLAREFSFSLPKTLEALQKIGFSGIEPMILLREEQGNIPKNLWALDTLREAKPLLDQLALRIPSVHLGVAFGWFSMPTGTIVRGIRRLHETYGIQDFVISGIFSTLAQARHWGSLAGKLAEAVQPDGCRVLYHNHDDEFHPVRDHGTQVLAMDAFLSRAGKHVGLQLDVGWAALAGDECAWMQRYASRIVSLHLKDFYPAYRTGYSRKTMPTEAFAPIAEGSVKMQQLLALCGQLPNFSGTLIIDQDKAAGDMLTALSTGCRNVQTLLEGV